uniref:F-box domain-containing protein n=1 Tax=Oryza punctata TaxID=4537 RepID=A0A0E0K1G7_ORYPU
MRESVQTSSRSVRATQSRDTVRSPHPAAAGDSHAKARTPVHASLHHLIPHPSRRRLRRSPPAAGHCPELLRTSSWIPVSRDLVPSDGLEAWNRIFLVESEDKEDLMGSVVSSANTSARSMDRHEKSGFDSNKRVKISTYEYDSFQRIIPTLPDELSFQILARLPRLYYLKLKMVSQAWKAAITSSELSQLRRELGLTEEWLYVLTKLEPNKLDCYALDPLFRKWQRLPLMPSFVSEEESTGRAQSSWFQMWKFVGSSIRIADFIKGWFRRRYGLDQMPPFCGCSVGVADGCLYVFGGFSRAVALNCVFRYDPYLNVWQEVSPMISGRAFSKAALLQSKLYVVGGVSRGRNGLLPLRSGEVFDPKTGIWSELPEMPFMKAQVLPTAFLADVLKPIATGMASYNGKLYVPQSLYSWPFFFDIGGEIYDPELNSWETMPDGLGDGWPARQAGTKLGIVVNEELYTLEPSSSLDSGQIKRYDSEQDTWKTTVPQVPVHDFTDAEAPFLLAGLHGKVHVITKEANNNLQVMQAVLQNNIENSPSEENIIWNILASKNFGSAELVSCQVLDV